MVDILSKWKYSNVDVERQQKLAAPGSFENLIQLVVDDIREITVRAKSGELPSLKHCLQPIFSFQLPRTGDPLFNGPWGYRAQYWLSPETGLAANAKLIAALKPILLAAVDFEQVPDLKDFNIASSLAAASAKIWINESAQSTFLKDLEIERWVNAANHGNAKAESGLWAPKAKQFEIKGALIDPSGNEIVPADKICRHFEIHNYGFS
jgi:hypothetical protein